MVIAKLIIEWCLISALFCSIAYCIWAWIKAPVEELEAEEEKRHQAGIQEILQRTMKSRVGIHGE